MKQTLTEQQILNRRARFRRWYAKHKDKENQRTLEYQRRKQKEFEEWKTTQSCSECGENHPACLDFHHIDPTRKHRGISNLRDCPNKLKEELAKCVVLCSNCHKKLHWAEKKGISPK